MVWKNNFSQVAKISCRLVQKWPRYKKKPQKWTLKNDFSEKSPRILNFWKKFLKTYIKRANLAETDISGYEIYPKGPSWEMWIVMLKVILKLWVELMIVLVIQSIELILGILFPLPNMTCSFEELSLDYRFFDFVIITLCFGRTSLTPSSKHKRSQTNLMSSHWTLKLRKSILIQDITCSTQQLGIAIVLVV